MQNKIKDNKIINDQYIKDLFFNDRGYVNPNYLKRSWLEKHPDITDYLNNRYTDSLSIKETAYRIYMNIEIRPVCSVCGNSVQFDPEHRNIPTRNGWPYARTCSAKCMANDVTKKEHTIQTSLLKYGTKNPSQSQIVQDKIKQTNLERYGVESVFASDEIKEKIKQTNIERYGIQYTLQNAEVKAKAQETNIKKYGTKTFAESDTAKSNWYLYVEKAKQPAKERYGEEYYTRTPDFKTYMSDHKAEFEAKRYETKKRNNSFSISKKEELLHELLVKDYPDIIREYKSELYPYSCDFYIPSLNLYIEYQGVWTHGSHPYNEKWDSKQFESMKEKSLSSEFYRNAIHIWTEVDPQKRNTAKQNKLNYLEIYPFCPLKDIPNFIKEQYKEDTVNKQIVIGTK